MGQVIGFPEAASSLSQVMSEEIPKPHTVPIRVLDIRPHRRFTDGRTGFLLQVGNWKHCGTVMVYDEGCFDHYVGPELAVNTCLQGVFSWKRGRDGYHLLVAGEAIVPEDYGPVLIPRQWAARPGDLATLVLLVENLRNPLLKAFLNGILADPQRARAFVTIPVSQREHHPYPGGNLAHSLEVAFGAANAVAINTTAEYELLLVAGLLHDIGRVMVYDAHGRYKATGYTKHHDALTPEVLGNHIQAVEAVDAALANRLRHLLYRTEKDRNYPQSPAYAALLAADRQSVMRYHQRQAFAAKPSWYNRAFDDGGQCWMR